MNFNRGFIIITALVFIILLFYTAIYEEAPERTRITEIQLFFSDQEAMYLIPETRKIETEDNIYIETLEKLINGPENPNLSRTIPDGTEVLGVYSENSTVYVDFNQALKINHWGGSTGERITIYSIVNTLTQFREIDEVQIMINSEKIETLVGHLNLRKPLAKDETIIK